MKTKVILFDLDGTLLPMDQELFTKTYFGLLAKSLVSRGYESQALIDTVWKGTAAMIRNNGEKSNEEVFWSVFSTVYGERAREDRPYFDAFYRTEFDQAKAACRYEPQAAQVLAEVKKMGYRVALATNPFFPAVATERRMAWAGLAPDDFEWYTTYENSHFCKPNLAYYREVTEHLGVTPQECLMVGNDVQEDMVAMSLGMKVFLLTDCLINKEARDISVFPNGSFAQLLAYIRQAAR